MPRPPVLPMIDWRKVFFGADEFPTWLEKAEYQENRNEMVRSLDALTMEPTTQSVLLSLKRPVHVIAIAEDWCGDVVRHVPVLERLAGTGVNLLTRYLTRTEQPEVFARFLTNGGEAIPKFIFFNHEFVECGNWGPMSRTCRAVIARGKACGDIPTARKKVAALYAADANRREVLDELLELVVLASTTEP